MTTYEQWSGERMEAELAPLRGNKDGLGRRVRNAAVDLVTFVDAQPEDEDDKLGYYYRFLALQRAVREYVKAGGEA